MSVNEEIRHKLADVAANKLSVWDFKDWIEPHSWSMHRDLDKDSIRLIGSIQSAFDLYDYEGADESLLRRKLFALLKPAVQYFEIRVQVAVGRVSEASASPITATARRPIEAPEILIALPV